MNLANIKTTVAGIAKGVTVIGGVLFHAFLNGQFTGLHGVGLAFGIMEVISGYYTADAKSKVQPANSEANTPAAK